MPPLVLPADGGAGRGSRAAGCRWASTRTPSTRSAPCRWTAGDTLLAFTDGLVEARGGGELFGEQRVREAAAQAAVGRSMQELVTAVHLAARRFSGGLQDDAVLLALRHR